MSILSDMLETDFAAACSTISGVSESVTLQTADGSISFAIDAMITGRNLTGEIGERDVAWRTITARVSKTDAVEGLGRAPNTTDILVCGGVNYSVNKVLDAVGTYQLQAENREQVAKARRAR